MAQFVVTTAVTVDASDAEEAALIVERLMAGRLDSALITVVRVEGGGR